MTLCCVWMSAELVTEQEKQMPLDVYTLKDESYFVRKRLVARLVEYALCAYLFCAGTFGTVVGGLWATGYVEIWLP